MHVAVLGAGYAGISLVKQLADELPSSVSLTLVEQNEYHLVQHLLHRTIREPALADHLSIPLEELLSRAEHRQDVVTDVDPDTGTVELEDGRIDYDVGAICLGAQTAFYGIPGVLEHATPLKTLEHTERIRSEFGTVCERDGRAVVAGAGLSGIQVAGELAAIADECDGEPDVLLLEQAGTVAPSFSGRFQSAIAEELTNQGIDVQTGRSVERVSESEIELDDGTDQGYDQLVWTGGITGQDSMAGARPQVRADLRLGDRTFGLGDAVRVIDRNGQPAPASAQTAINQADVAATNVTRLTEYTHDSAGFEPRMSRYRYESLGWLVSIGDETVAQVGPTVFRGPKADVLKTSVGAGYLSDIGAVERATEHVREAFVKKKSK